jgi:adenosylcobinamide-phosphate synthase
MPDPKILLLALILDAALGDPDWLYRAVPHPVVLFGRAIDWLDRRLNRESDGAAVRRALGMVAMTALIAASVLVGWILHSVLAAIPLGWIVEALLMSTLIAQNSLYRHVARVAAALDKDGLAGGRVAVAEIVGRDPNSLDEAGVARAAIESLAENFSDGVTAPLFWGVIAGLPGVLAYKAINTADSMIGHRTPRHGDFGWAAARLDDFVNILPARLAGLFIAAAGALLHRGEPLSALRTMWRDAPKHRSFNAGWPEAAMAGALGLALNGPRVYEGELVNDPWMGDGRADATTFDIRSALGLYVVACAIQAVLIIALYALI